MLAPAASCTMKTSKNLILQCCRFENEFKIEFSLGDVQMKGNEQSRSQSKLSVKSLYITFAHTVKLQSWCETTSILSTEKPFYKRHIPLRFKNIQCVMVSISRRTALTFVLHVKWMELQKNNNYKIKVLTLGLMWRCLHPHLMNCVKTIALFMHTPQAWKWLSPCLRL